MMTLMLATISLYLDSFDQTKLAALVGEIPTTIREKKVTPLTTPVTGFKVSSRFPKTEGPFAFICESSYYNRSLYASYGSCKVEIDEHHPEVQRSWDEYKIVVTDPEVVATFNKIIPTGRPPYKEFRSFGKEPGKTFDGKFAKIFYYYIRCNKDQCTFKFPVTQNPEP